jgi:hypothetical protein
MLISADSCDIDLCGTLPISTEGERILVQGDLGHESAVSITKAMQN